MLGSQRRTIILAQPLRIQGLFPLLHKHIKDFLDDLMIYDKGSIIAEYIALDIDQDDIIYMRKDILYSIIYLFLISEIRVSEFHEQFLIQDPL